MLEAATQDAPAASAVVSRTRALGEAWAALGPRVAVLANAAGHPLARTVKLILDPLVIRPQQRPQLAAGSLSAEAAAELRQLLAGAQADLIATAGWYQALKQARRSARITDGNPQDLYFQRCFELAREHGDPAALSATRRTAIAADQVAALAHDGSKLTSERLLEYVRDPARAAQLATEVDAAWRKAGLAFREQVKPDPSRVLRALDGSHEAFEALVAAGMGSSTGATQFNPQAAADLGLTEHEIPRAPAVGTGASKRHLPRPYDRSIVERLFAALPSLAEIATARDLPQLCVDEARRSAAGWQLAHEDSRVTMALGAEASSALTGASDASAPSRTHTRLRERWEREAYVRRAKRMPLSVPAGTLDDVADIRGAYMRRLWVRLHGRELREQPVMADEVDSTLDGVLRSVVLDQRHRLKRSIEREHEAAA